MKRAMKSASKSALERLSGESRRFMGQGLKQLFVCGLLPFIAVSALAQVERPSCDTEGFLAQQDSVEQLMRLPGETIVVTLRIPSAAVQSPEAVGLTTLRVAAEGLSDCLDSYELCTVSAAALFPARAQVQAQARPQGQAPAEDLQGGEVCGVVLARGLVPRSLPDSIRAALRGQLLSSRPSLVGPLSPPALVDPSTPSVERSQFESLTAVSALLICSSRQSSGRASEAEGQGSEGFSPECFVSRGQWLQGAGQASGQGTTGGASAPEKGGSPESGSSQRGFVFPLIEVPIEIQQIQETRRI